MELAEQAAFVTGAAGGIGRATAIALAEAGTRLIIADVAVDELEETAALVREKGGEVIVRPTDVSRAEDVEALVAAVLQAYGRLDIAVNNAGIGGSGQFDPWDVGGFERIMAINAHGVFHGMRYALPAMLAQGRGVIVNMASIAGLVGVGSPAYAASKHAVVGLTRAAAISYAGRGVRINAVAPGVIDTAMVRQAVQASDRGLSGLPTNPNGRTGRPEEVADAVVWLCSDRSAMVNGHVLPLDGGFTAG